MRDKNSDGSGGGQRHLDTFSAYSDRELAERILGGDQPLFELIMRRYNRRLFRIAWSVLKDDSLAQDALQEAYLLAYNRLRQFRGNDAMGSWLSTITLRCAFALARKQHQLELVDTPAPVDPDSEPDLLAQNCESKLLVERAISTLPLDFRLVFMLREIEDLSIDETAACLGISHGTVKSRLHRAKQILKARLKTARPDLEEEPFAFAGTRCDAIVAGVLGRLDKPQIE